MTEFVIFGRNSIGHEGDGWLSRVAGDDQQYRIRVLVFNLALFVCVPIYAVIYLALGAPISAGIVASA